MIQNILTFLSMSKIASNALALGVLISAFFAPMGLIVIMLISLVVLDLVTAIPKHWRDNNIKGFWKRAKSITSKGLRSTAVKATLYVLFTGAVFLLGMASFNPVIALYLAQTTGAAFGLVELRSIAENMDMITGKNVFVQAIKSITKKLTDSLVKWSSRPDEL